MQVFNSLEAVQLADVVLTIGNFDGVHRGHQTILDAGQDRAGEADTQLVVMTFDPHPLAILTPQHVPPTLTPLPEKLHWLEHYGVDIAVVVRSDPDFLRLSAEAFIQDVIMARFDPMAMVEGASFGFGRKREGDVRTLRGAGRRLGFEVEVIQPVQAALGGHPDAVISSSLTRQLLRSGAVDQAIHCLGRPYALLGTVERGEARGRVMGYPTVNLATGHQLIPAEGVYAGRAQCAGRTYPAAVNVGRRPTFDRSDPNVEAHLIGFEGDLYGQSLRLELLDAIRQIHTFGSPQDLREQIARDVETARAIVERFSDP